MGRKKKKVEEEAVGEDWCFSCKDGGLLLLCDHKQCPKAYHPVCVGKDDSFLGCEVQWICEWHSCFQCNRTTKFHCFCCPRAVCAHCIWDAEFAVVRGTKGFCNHCLSLTALIEGAKDPDSDERKIDFCDPDTYEFMFKGYWEMIKKNEGLTSEDVRSADLLLSKGYGSDYCMEDCESQQTSDYDDSSDTTEHKSMHKRKRNKGNSCVVKRKVKGKEFIGWASKQLLNFLASIDKDTTQTLSQHDVVAIITGYCKQYKLFHPEKKKKVLCDARLQALLGRKSVNKNRIFNLLTAHFAENFEQSADEFGYSSEGNLAQMSCKRQQNSDSDQLSLVKEVVPDVLQNHFASVIAENIKLLYLRRSLVEELLKQPETFDAKVTGSFVRVKSDPYDYFQKNSHQLLQVTGIKKIASDGSDIILQVSTMPRDIPICKLSNDNFSKEECDDLCQRVKDGLLKRPTVVEFEEKARDLHEVITKHWIVKELARLQNLINQANEKGWRRQLSEYIDRKLLLQTPMEQSRLLNEVPKVIADKADAEPSNQDIFKKREEEHNEVQESFFKNHAASKPPKGTSKDNKSPCFLDDRAEVGGILGDAKIRNDASAGGLIRSGSTSKDEQHRDDSIGIDKNDTEEEKQHSEASASEELHQFSHSISHQSKDDDLRTERRKPFQEVEQNHPKALHPKPLSGQSLFNIRPHQSDAFILEKQNQYCNAISRKAQIELVNAEQEKVEKKQSAKTIDIVELSDDEEQDGRVLINRQTPDNLHPIWYCMTPRGLKSGPFSMAALKEWSDASPHDLKLKVWKTDQNPEEAIFLTDAIRQALYRK